MSLSIGMPYTNGTDTFMCTEVLSEDAGTVYVGELTDARGCRRHAVPEAETSQWQPVAVASLSTPEQTIARQLADAETLKSNPSFRVPQTFNVETESGNVSFVEVEKTPPSKSVERRWAAQGKPKK